LNKNLIRVHRHDTGVSLQVCHEQVHPAPSIHSREMFADCGLSWLKARLKFFVDSIFVDMKRLKVHFASQTVVRSWIKHPELSNSIGKMCTFAFVMRIQIRGVSISLSFFLSRARALRRVISLFKCINVCMFTAVANKAKLESEFLATCFVQ